MTTTTTPDPAAEGLRLLRIPFPPEQVGKLPKKNRDGSTAYISYVGHSDATARLLDADPRWDWEPLALDAGGLPLLDGSGNLWIRLTVCGVTRLGVGDGASIKEKIGDAIRNAAMRFGVALDLWAKGDRDFTASNPPPPAYIDQVVRQITALPDEQKTALKQWWDEMELTTPEALTAQQAADVLSMIATINGGWPPVPESHA